MERACGSECEVMYKTHGMRAGGSCSCSCACHVGAAETCAGCPSMHRGVVDPVGIGIVMWKKAFGHAMIENQKEKVKKRIEAAWGPVMDKVAEAVIDSMGKTWQSMLQQAGAEQELREKLERIWSEAGRQ